MKGAIALLIVLVVVAGLLVGARMILHDGLSARAKPTSAEAYVARHLRNLAIPANAKRMENPVPNSPEALHEAMMHFADHCATCHANDGSGDSMFGSGLYPKPPDLRLAATQNLSDGELFWIIENGVRFTGMPAFSAPGMQNDSWKLVRFIRRLPRLTPEEKLEMQENNPKSPDDRQEEQQEEDFLNGAAPQPSDGAAHHH